MKARIYPLLEEAIEVGVRRGYRRAFKHNENPCEGAIMEAIENCIMAEILDRFVIDDDSL
jgi:hypothetical protein